MADKHEDKNVVTQENFNKVVYEIKNEIREVDVKHEKEIMKLQHFTEKLSSSIDHFNENTQKLTEMLAENLLEAKETKQELIEFQKREIDRDRDIEDLKEFKQSTEESNKLKTKELLTFLGIVATGAFSVIVAIIQVSIHFF